MLAFVCHSYHRGGVTRWMIDMAVGYQQRKGRCWFVTPKPKVSFGSGEGRMSLTQLLEAYSTDVRPILINPEVGREFEYGTTEYRAAIYARAIASSVPPKVPLIVSDDAAVWMGAAHVSWRNPMIGVLHSDDQPYYELARRYSKAVSALVSVSRRISSKVQSLEGCASVPEETIPCGIPLRVMEKKDDTGRGDELRLIWVGRIEEHQKRVSDLPKIAAELKSSGLKFKLLVIGDGPERAWLERDFRERGLTAEAHLLGWQATPEVMRLLASSDLLLLPSNYEGMPISIMEALSAGCAVVASRVSGVEDYERHPLAEDCLWIHDIGDVQEAARLVRSAADVPRARRRAQARALAEAEFSIETCVERYDDFMSRLPLEKAAGSTGKIPSFWLAALNSYPVAALRMAKLRVSSRR